MLQKWLVRLSTESPELIDPDRISFEKDKTLLDTFFVSHGYKVLIINIFQPKSYQVSNQEVYVLGNDFFQQYSVFESLSTDNMNSDPPYLIQAFDKIVMGLHCLKDVVQQINEIYYIYPHALRLIKLFELLGYDVKPAYKVCEGGIFLQGIPPIGSPFLIISHDLTEPFNELQTAILQCPPRIGMNINDTHIDVYLGIINFREQISIQNQKYNGILYILKETLQKILRHPVKRRKWANLREDLVKRSYLVREYSPETPLQKIGINFKFDIENLTLLTNAFPQNEQTFLQQLGIRVLAPEYSFGSNDYLSGGMNCSYLLIPHSETLHNIIITWIKNII